MGTDNPVLGSRKGGVEVDLSAVQGAVKFAAAERVGHDSALEALWMRHTTIERSPLTLKLNGLRHGFLT